MITTSDLRRKKCHKSIGKKAGLYCKCAAALKLPPEIQEMGCPGQDSSGHARAIAGIKERKSSESLRPRSEKNRPVRQGDGAVAARERRDIKRPASQRGRKT